jgi:LysR family transcriptional regulator, nitrogen assimilation regulatory protein
MDLRQIQYFLSLYEQKSVTRAAQQLNIVQPALSMQIAKLERDIGRPLFIRTPKGMLPTPAGDEMYRLFTPVMAEFSRVRAKVTHANAPLSGHVRVGAVASIGHNALPTTLLDFSARYPTVTLSITEGLTLTICEMITAGQLDIAILNRPSRIHGVMVEPIFTEPIVLASSASAHQELPKEIRLKDLVASRFVMSTQGHGLRQLLDEGLREAGISIAPALEVDSFLTQAILVNQGLFLALLPESLIRNLTIHGRINLRTHRLLDFDLKREMVWIHNSRRPPGPAALEFRKALTANLLRAINDHPITA